MNVLCVWFIHCGYLLIYGNPQSPFVSVRLTYSQFSFCCGWVKNQASLLPPGLKWSSQIRNPELIQYFKLWSENVVWMGGCSFLLGIPLKHMGPNANFWVLCGDAVLTLEFISVLNSGTCCLHPLLNCVGSSFQAGTLLCWLLKQGVICFKEAKGRCWVGGGKMALELLPAELRIGLGYF